MRIAVGLSGGVDSSVTAALLKKAGHDVVGITMKLWREGKYKGGEKDSCFGPKESESIAMADALCRSLGIPFHVFDVYEDYEKIVLDYFRNEYLNGRTPNPCIRCNSFIKFGVLPELALKSGLEFDKFATGHYARIVERDGAFRLLRGVDETKDQSYFLYRLSQRQLSRTLFPLGGMRKSEVRALAAEFALAAKDNAESQDFYSGDQAELIDTPDREGNIVDTSGKVLGRHKGFWHYTIGQRRGLGVASTHPLYVVELNACRNEVVLGDSSDVQHHEIDITDCTWICGEPE
ncbi:MAG: tRNA 2-thiouridine(34) synthase MnmA, partial [Victivallales bacterium]|nr:tRNA 2-thiouridine(34) synthase MnmA [Victivallales bacterium]